MKNKTIISIIVLMSLLTACGTASASAEISADNDGTDAASPVQIRDRDTENGGFEQPLSNQLIFGTFGLELTDYAVGAEQAAELLPLWKAARALSDSETVAAAEMDAIFNQIADTMSPEQWAEIENIEFGQQDFTAIAEELGVEVAVGVGRGFENLTDEERAEIQAARESGQGPPGGGGLPGAEGRGPGGEGLSPEARETAIAERGDQFGAGRGFSNPAFFDAIITLLESKVQ